MICTIICIGNRFVNKDSAGLAVYDSLQNFQYDPLQVEIIEGGIAGLNLLPLLERGGRVLFVDAVSGFTQPGEIILLTSEEIIQAFSGTHYGHEAGLAYLLTVLPLVAEGEIPKEILLIGIEGSSTPDVITKAAKLSLEIAEQGIQGLQ